MSDETRLTDEYDIDAQDELDEAIFEFINHLRRQGYSFREIVPRLRENADYCEEHAEKCDRWDETLGAGDIVLPGDSERQ